MSGRYEQDHKKEIWIEKKLSSQPKIYFNYMTSIKKKTSSTRKAYLGYLIDFSNFINDLNIKLENVKPMDIDSYIDYLANKGNKEAIINAKLSAIISFYGFLVENDIISKNPCSAKKKLVIKPNEKVVYMTDDEINNVRNDIIKSSYKYSNRNLCILKLGCSTGLRVSAIVNIDIEDINFIDKTIKVIEKGNKERIVNIGDNTIAIILKWINDRKSILGNETGALFISQKTHERISTDAVENMIKRYTKGINKHITPHKMRSTCAMKLYDKTGDIYLTAQQLGHANIKNTMIYAKATDEKRRMAAEILD